MSDRGPFPPFRDEAGGDLPPIGGGDPDQTQWMPGRPDPGPEPTGIMPPVEGGGAFEPGPPFGAVPADVGGPGGPIGPDDPALEFEEEPEPWYRQPGPLAALATGILALILLIVALVVLLGDDDGDDELTDTSLPPPVTTSTTLPLTVAPTAVPLPPPTEVVATEPPTTPVPEPATTPATEPPTTTTVPETTTTVPETTTTVPETTTTVPETTTTTSAAPTTTLAPTTLAPTTTDAPIPTAAPDDTSPWELIQASPSLTELRDAIERADLVELFERAGITVLAPDNTAFETLRASVGGEELLDDPDRLRPLLQRHVILQPLTLAQLFALDEVESSEGEILTIDGEAETIEGAEVIPDGGDRDTPNGSFLHAIDLVIV